MKQNVVAIIQARMGSTRLPGKVLMDLCGKPILKHVVERTRAAEGIDEVVIATTTSPADDAIVAFCRENEISVFRGSEENVLERYYLCAEEYGGTLVVRMTSDNPLLCPKVLEQHLKWFASHPAPYSYTADYPVGLCGEIFTFEGLRDAYLHAEFDYEREHVSPYLRREGKPITIMHYEGKREDLPSYRFTVDTPEDLEFARRVFAGLYPEKPNFEMEDVLKFLDENPALLEINRHVHQKKIGE